MRPNTSRSNENNAKIIYLEIKDCVPMPEVEREFYSPFVYRNVKSQIQKEGYDGAYPIRVRWNEQEQVYETFDGIHRLLAMKELRISETIPAVDDSHLSRAEAIVKGIKANINRATLNPIDFAKSLEALGKHMSETKIADRMGVSQQKISQLRMLRKLPEDVQTLIGMDKLRFRHGRALTSLLGTPYESKISDLAQRAVDGDMTARTLEKAVASIRKTGIYSDDSTCPACKKVMPRDSFGRVCLDCMGKLRSGDLDRESVEKHNEARRRYLKLKALTDRHFPNDSVPEHFKIVLNEFHEKWHSKP